MKQALARCLMGRSLGSASALEIASAFPSGEPCAHALRSGGCHSTGENAATDGIHWKNSQEAHLAMDSLYLELPPDKSEATRFILGYLIFRTTSQ